MEAPAAVSSIDAPVLRRAASALAATQQPQHAPHQDASELQPPSPAASEHGSFTSSISRMR